jgi:hypothetical protein
MTGSIKFNLGKYIPVRLKIIKLILESTPIRKVQNSMIGKYKPVR